MARDLTVFSVHLPPIDWFSCDFVQQARDLGVEKIVTGGVRETESMVRVHVRVIDAESGAYILAGSFDRKKEDALAINDEIAQAIADEMTEKSLRCSASPT
jgi:TolB-like protein